MYLPLFISDICFSIWSSSEMMKYDSICVWITKCEPLHWVKSMYIKLDMMV